jgi:hypothetical protein
MSRFRKSSGIEQRCWSKNELEQEVRGRSARRKGSNRNRERCSRNNLFEAGRRLSLRKGGHSHALNHLSGGAHPCTQDGAVNIGSMVNMLRGMFYHGRVRQGLESQQAESQRDAGRDM